MWIGSQGGPCQAPGRKIKSRHRDIRMLQQSVAVHEPHSNLQRLIESHRTCSSRRLKSPHGKTVHNMPSPQLHGHSLLHLLHLQQPSGANGGCPVLRATASGHNFQACMSRRDSGQRHHAKELQSQLPLPGLSHGVDGNFAAHWIYRIGGSGGPWCHRATALIHVDPC